MNGTIGFRRLSSIQNKWGPTQGNKIIRTQHKVDIKCDNDINTINSSETKEIGGRGATFFPFLIFFFILFPFKHKKFYVLEVHYIFFSLPFSLFLSRRIRPMEGPFLFLYVFLIFFLLTPFNPERSICHYRHPSTSACLVLAFQAGKNCILFLHLWWKVFSGFPFRFFTVCSTRVSAKWWKFSPSAMWGQSIEIFLFNVVLHV